MEFWQKTSHLSYFFENPLSPSLFVVLENLFHRKLCMIMSYFQGGKTFNNFPANVRVSNEKFQNIVYLLSGDNRFFFKRLSSSRFTFSSSLRVNIFPTAETLIKCILSGELPFIKTRKFAFSKENRYNSFAQMEIA